MNIKKQYYRPYLVDADIFRHTVIGWALIITVQCITSDPFLALCYDWFVHSRSDFASRTRRVSRTTNKGQAKSTIDFNDN